MKAFVVLLHQGGAQVPPAPPASPSATPAGDEYTDVNRCVNFNGPEMKEIAGGLDPRVSVIVSAHTHQPYVCRFSGKLVTSAASFGRLVTSIDLTIDHRTKKVTATSAFNHIVTQDVAKDAGAKAILDKYTTLSAPLANRVLGSVTSDIRSARDTPSGQNAAGEQPMGDVIADAMLEATTPTDFGGAVAAFMNSGGVRAGLLANQISGGEQPGQVTYGEAFNVQPFGNTLVVKTCTGQQIYDVLNQQFGNPAAGSNRIMLPVRERPLPMDDRRRAARRGRDGVVQRRDNADLEDRALPRSREQLHGGRWRQLHGLPLMHTAARAARSTSTRSPATWASTRPWRRRR